MLAALLFCIYLATNLTSLLLASAAQKKKTKFINSTAVAVSEAVKCAMSVLLIWLSKKGGNAQSVLATVHQALFADLLELLKVCIPAMLYLIQNNVIYTALAHLDAVTFQIAYQLKIVVALVSHRILLGKCGGSLPPLYPTSRLRADPPRASRRSPRALRACTGASPGDPAG